MISLIFYLILFLISFIGIIKVRPPTSSAELPIYCFLAIFPILWIFFYSGNGPDSKLKNKKKAMYPPIPKKILQSKRTIITFGKKGTKYIGIDPRTESNSSIGIFGGSGSGKSAGIIIPFLLACQQSMPLDKKEKYQGISYFCLDLKGELAEKTSNIQKKNHILINPNERQFSWGYNPLYRLKDCNKNDTQLMFEVFKEIAIALLPMDRNSDSFWTNNARNLLIVLSIYFFKNGIPTLPAIIEEIRSNPISELIDTIYEECEPGIIRRLLTPFKDLAEETMSGIISNLFVGLDVFEDQSIHYMLDEHPKKFNPQYLNHKKPVYVYLVISEDKLTAYSTIIQMIFFQILSEMERRKEGARDTFIVLDEFGRLLEAGKAAGTSSLPAKVNQALSTLRSKNCRVIYASQSLDSLLSGAYSKDELNTILSNTGWLLFLDAKGQTTKDFVMKSAGTYQEESKSWNIEKGKYKSSVSFRDRNILEEKDLIEILDKKEAILINSYNGYCRFKKAMYFGEKNLSDIVNRNQKINQIYF